MPQIASPFRLNSSSPNFARDQFATLSEMAAVGVNDIDVGHISYCVANQTYYKFVGNTEDGEVGYFVKLKLGDLSEEEIVALIEDEVDSKMQDATYREVLSVTSLPTASADTLNRLYLLEGDSSFTQYITTRSKLVATDTSIDNSLIINGTPTSITTFEDGYYYLYLKAGAPILLYNNTGSDITKDAYDEEYDATGITEITVAEGDIYWDEDEECWVAGTDSWTANEDPYSYDWLSLGETSFDVSSKQDALEYESGYALAEIDGTTYALPATAVTTPLAPSISVTLSPSSDTSYPQSAKFAVTTNTSGATLEYSIDGGDTWVTYSSAYEVTADESISSATGEPITFMARAKKYGLTSSVASRNDITLYRRLSAPSITVTATSDGNYGSKTITISLPTNTGDCTYYYQIGSNTAVAFSGTTTLAAITGTTTYKVWAESSDSTWMDSVVVSQSITANLTKTRSGVVDEGTDVDTDDEVISNLASTAGYSASNFASGVTVTFTLSNNRAAIAYPSSYGELTSIVDANNIACLDDFVHVTTSTYHVYYLGNKATATNFSWTFKI